MDYVKYFSERKACWGGAICCADHIEVYKCSRALNNRENLYVYVWRNARWDSRTQQKVTARTLKNDGWNLLRRSDEKK